MTVTGAPVPSPRSAPLLQKCTAANACLLRVALLLVFALLGASGARGQQAATVSGFVTDDETGETLLLANVIVLPSGPGGATNLSGYYAIADLAPGTYTVRCSYIGFVTRDTEITLLPGENRRLDIALAPENVVVDEILITAEALVEEEARNVGVSRMTVATIKELPAIFEADVFRSLQLLPGITSASDYSSGLYIRGGNPGQTLILLDRTSVYNPTHVFGFFSTFNPDAIKDVQIFKGGFPASYGGRIGSVLDIYNKDGNRREFQAGLTLGVLASRAYAEGPYSKGSWMVAVRRSTLEPLLAILDDVNAVPDAFSFADVNSKVNLDATPNDRLSFSFYLGQDNLRLSFLEDSELRLRYGNRTASANWTHLFSETLFSTFTLTTSRYQSKPRVRFGGTEFGQDNRVYDSSLKGDFEYYPNDRHLLEGGFWAGYIVLPLRSIFDGETGIEWRNRSAYASAYVQDRFELGALWTIQGGLRATFFANGRHTRLSPRLSAEFRPGQRVRLQTSLGRYYQFQTLITNESFAGFDIWLTSGPGVRPAYGDQFIMGAKLRLGEAYTLDTEAYYRTMRELFELDPFLPEPAGLEYAELFTIGRGAAKGVELKIEKMRGRLSGFAAATLGNTWRRFPILNLDLDGNPQQYSPKYDRLVDINAVANYDLGRSWQLTGVLSFATGQAHTEPQAQYRLVTTELLTGNRTTDVLLSPGLNEARLPPYHRLDLGARKSGRFFGFADYDLQLQVINVYARRNTWFILHEFEDDNTVTRNDVPQIPIPLPNVSLSLQF